MQLNTHFAYAEKLRRESKIKRLIQNVKQVKFTKLKDIFHLRFLVYLIHIF